MNYTKKIQTMRACYETGATRSVPFRIDRLHVLAKNIILRERAIQQALYDDLRKSPLESYAAETGYVLRDIRHAIKHIYTWSRSVKVKTPLGLRPAKSIIRPEAKGVVLIMGPWNYPFQLIISPLTAAIAAGNSAVLKPSEYAPRTAEVIHEIIKASFDSDYICVVQGNADTAAELLRQPFDHVFYTGSTEVGRKVMTAAAKQLTPVTLELGGKSPAIVTGKARLPVTARRIARGKFMNAGQTCVAPDHVWVMESAAEALLHELTTAIRSFFGTEPRQSRDFGRIINDRHWQRLNDYLQEQSPVIGGEADPAERYIAPTVIKNPPLDSPLMQEEIFGPILPVLTYNSLDALLVSLRRKPTPLALYVFSESGEEQDRITSRLPSGGVCINDTIAHLTVPDLPFGGQGTSGMGAYHGRSGFDTFTHYRSILQRSTRGDMKAMYPPFSVPLKIFKRLYRFLFG